MARLKIKGVKHDGPIKRRSIFEVLSTPNDGASPRGSTFFKSAMGCPREHALSNVAGLRPEQTAEPLTTGWLFHYCLQLFYQSIMDHQQSLPYHPRDPEWLWGGEKAGMMAAYEQIETLEAEHGYGETAETCRRMLDAYFERYSRQDNWRIVAVEVTLFYHGGDKPGEGFEYSCRLDLLVEDFDRGGLWIVEHKSARQLSADLLDNYQLDIQILGQAWLILECIDLDKYPPFRGIKINITTKHKEPKTVRLEVCPSPGHLRGFERAVSGQIALLPIYAELGWPQFLGHCAGFARGYGRCQFFEVCHGHPDMTVQDWIDQEDPPHGFVRAEKES